MSGHTPGPWSVPHFAREHGCHCGYVFAGEYCGGIAEVYVDNGKSLSDGGNDCPKDAEAQANARLIAAAPALLAALEGLTCYELFRKLPDDFRARVDDAIALARGAP